MKKRVKPKRWVEDRIQAIETILGQTLQRLSIIETVVENYILMKKDDKKIEKYLRKKREAKDAEIKILALSPKQIYKEIYQGEEENFDSIIYCTSNPPFGPLTLCDKTEIVYHACEWDKNYLDEQKTEDLARFLKNKIEDIDFCFMEVL